MTDVKDIDIRLKGNVCPTCGYPNDAATNVMDDTATPSPGDIGICLLCQQLLIYTDTLGIRAASENEIEDILDNNPELVNAFSLSKKLVQVWDCHMGAR